MSSFSVVRLRKVWFGLSIIMIGLSLGALFGWGLRFGIDFTGGSLMAFRFETRPSSAVLTETLRNTNADLASAVLQPVGEQEVQIRTKQISQKTYESLLATLSSKHGNVTGLRFDTFDPLIGKELRTKSLQGVIVALLLIVAYIAFVFRKVSAPIVSWKYGVVTMLAALHDVLVPLGVFAWLGHTRGIEVGTPFVAAMLTILGYSITDTIVVMDRVRENLPRMKALFDEVVDVALRQTFLRSLYTSFSTLITLTAIFLFGGTSLHEFTLAMIIGIVTGTYSSIFIAPTLLVAWNKIK